MTVRKVVLLFSVVLLLGQWIHTPGLEMKELSVCGCKLKNVKNLNESFVVYP